MLSQQELAGMQRELAGTPVLSMYLATDEHDPAERSSWRIRLAAQLDRLEPDAGDELREAFAAARSSLEAELRPYPGFLPGRGWAAFVTADRVWHCAEVPAPMPDLVRWQQGPVLGPYLRALKQNRHVVLVLIDSLRARVLRYRAGTLTELVDHRADEFIDDMTDRNMSKRAVAHSGVRGETATDAADRILRQEMERLLKHVVKELRLAGSDALVILGGPTSAVAAMQKLLAPDARERLLVEPALHMMMSLAEIQPLLEAAASTLTQRLQLTVVNRVVEAAGPAGLGALGMESTSAAAGLGQIDTLLVTPRFVAEGGAGAESLIAQVLELGGAVELVTDEAAALLESSGGVGASLRFAAARPPALVESSSENS